MFPIYLSQSSGICATDCMNESIKFQLLMKVFVVQLMRQIKISLFVYNNSAVIFRLFSSSSY